VARPLHLVVECPLLVGNRLNPLALCKGPVTKPCDIGGCHSYSATHGIKPAEFISERRDFVKCKCRIRVVIPESADEGETLEGLAA
jgi:hypothetical protein